MTNKFNLNSGASLILSSFMLVTIGLSESRANDVDTRCKNPYSVNIDKTVKIELCEIPANESISIGSDEGEINEKPVGTRKFIAFHMSKFEVTQLQYYSLMNSRPWLGKANVIEADNNPAVYITFDEAEQFAEKLTVLDRSSIYHLPTESEFEYSAKGGKNTKYFWGNEMDSKYAFYNGSNTNIPYSQDVRSCPSFNHNPEKSGYCANDYGLYHMLGNVWEWTRDAYIPYYREGAIWFTSGHFPAFIAGNFIVPRVLRGGAWDSEPSSLRVSKRAFAPQQRSFSNVGFRLVRFPRSLIERNSK